MEPPGPARVEVIEESTDAGKRRGLRITVEPKEVGQGSAKVVLATGLPQRPEIEHVVLWSARGNVEAPRQVHLDLGQPGHAEQVIQVRSRRPDFRLTAARIVEGPFRAAVLDAPVGAQRSIRLTTTLAGPPNVPTMGRLVLESNDPLEPKKEVVLSIAAQRLKRAAAATAP